MRLNPHPPPGAGDGALGEIPAHAIGEGKRKMWRFRLSELAEAVVAKKLATTARKSSIIDAVGSLTAPKGKGR